MSDDTKILDQNPVAQALPPVQTGYIHKEQAPPVTVEPNLSEFIKPEVEKPNIDQEQTDMGVMAKKEVPDLTPEHEEIGLKYSGPSVPVPPGPTGLVHIPLTREEALADLKIKKPDDSGWGFDKLVIKVLDALGF